MGQVISFCIPFCSESAQEDEEPYQMAVDPKWSEEEIAAERMERKRRHRMTPTLLFF